MKRLIVSGHAVKKARERIDMLKILSKRGTERWLEENVPSSKKIFIGSKLYKDLEGVYNKKKDKPFMYCRDSFGIYITEWVKGLDLYLHSVQRLDFKTESVVKLTEFFGDKQLIDLIDYRNALRRSQETNKQIEDLIA